MAKLRLTLACWNYDRTRALMEDRIPVDGIELTYLNLPVEEPLISQVSSFFTSSIWLRVRHQ